MSGFVGAQVPFPCLMAITTFGGCIYPIEYDLERIKVMHTAMNSLLAVIIISPSSPSTGNALVRVDSRWGVGMRGHTIGNYLVDKVVFIQPLTYMIDEGRVIYLPERFSLQAIYYAKVKSVAAGFDTSAVEVCADAYEMFSTLFERVLGKFLLPTTIAQLRYSI